MKTYPSSTPPTPSETPHQGPTHRWLVLALVSVALSMIVVDVTVLYTALPTLTHALSASAKEKLWIVNMYPLVVAGLLPGAGALGDRYGHRRVFLRGLVVFGVASLWAAYSPTATSLIAARAMLAVGAALMMPATLAIIRHSFPDQKERGFAIGVWAAVASGGAALGPVVGGFLLEYFWWGAVFLINVPVVVLALPLVAWFIANDAGNAQRDWDRIGSVLVLLGLLGSTYAIKAAAQNQPAWLEVLGTALLGVAFLAAFAWRQVHIHNPLIDFSLFRQRDFSSGVLAAVTVALALVGFQLVFSQWLQLVLGLSPLTAAYYMLPMPVAAFLAGPVAGLWLPRAGSKTILVAGMTMAGLGLLAAVWHYEAASWPLLVGLAVFGLGAGTAITGASSAIMFTAPPHKAGMAASIEEVSYELGGSLGVALMGSLMTASYAAALYLPEAQNFSPVVFDSLDEALLVAASLPPATANALVTAAHAAFAHAFVVVAGSIGGLLLLAALVVGLRRRDGHA